LTTSTRNAGSIRAKPSNRTAARPPVVRRNAVKTNGRPAAPAGAAPANDKPEQKVLFQKLFKSIGPRTYAAQIKELANGNHLLVLTEAKRDAQTGDVRKNKLFVFGEDLSAFFRLLHETATFIRANPLPEEIRKRREKYWIKKNREARNNGQSSDE
jgi:Protein of unknown function (DUF3276)